MRPDLRPARHILAFITLLAGGALAMRPAAAHGGQPFAVQGDEPAAAQDDQSAGPAAQDQPLDTQDEQSAAPSATSIDLELAKQYFAEARMISDADRGRLWGRPLYGPMLFADHATRVVVGNQPDPAGNLQQRSGVYVGILPDDVNIANTAVEWAGIEWTMMIWPLPDLHYPRGRLIAHELYHRIQDDIGLPASNPSNAHLDTSAARAWLRLEMRALTEALVQSGGTRTQAITDALVFRAYRRTLFPGAAAEENALEMNEGIAEYTGFTLGGLPRSSVADRVAVHLERYDDHDSFARSFAYATGAAYGVLLDETGANWRDRLTPESDLGELLREHMMIFTSDVTGIQAMRHAEKYGAMLVLDEEQARDQVRMARLDEFRDRFENGPTLTLPASGDISYSFNPNAVETFGDAGTVYRTARITDQWGVLEVTSGGALMQREGRMVARFIVPAPGDATARPLSGDGWSLTLNDGWRIAANGTDGNLILTRGGELADRTSGG